MYDTIVGVDLAKQVFQLYGVNEQGKRVISQRIGRAKFLSFFVNKPQMLVGMEACGGAHYWARQIEALGHDVRLMPPHRVKPYIQGNKNDRNDARGICEAVTRPDMTFVPIKAEEQQVTLGQHAVRQRRVESRTALINQVRGVLSEFGYVAPQGAKQARRLLDDVLGTDPGEGNPQGRLISLLKELRDEWNALDALVHAMDDVIEKEVKNNEVCQRIMAIKGVGILGASAIAGSVNDVGSFKNGRQFAAFLGLTPRERQSGTHRIMGGLTKRGNPYIRNLLIHGARAALWHLTKESATGPLSRWLKKMLERRGYNITVCALANKNARILWAMLARGTTYQPA